MTMDIEIGRVRSVTVSPAGPALYGGGFARDIVVVDHRGVETTITLRSDRQPSDLAIEDGMVAG